MQLKSLNFIYDIFSDTIVDDSDKFLVIFLDF